MAEAFLKSLGRRTIFKETAEPTEKYPARSGIAVYVAIVAVALAGLVACISPEIERAFQPKMEADGSNKVIAKYCASCHLHKDFSAEPHLERVRPMYSAEPFKSSSECRTCHTYTKNWLMDIKRGTHRESIKK